MEKIMCYNRKNMVMKRIMLVVLIAITMAGVSQARDTEISVSYGAFPAMDHMSVYSDSWNGMDHSWGTASFTIDHRFASRLWVGLSYTFSSASSSDVKGGLGGDVTWHGLLVNARYEWFNRSSLTLYSHGGVGVVVSYLSPQWEPSYNECRFGFQVSPVGVQWDVSRYAGLFAECGYGVQGVLKVGVRVGF